MPCRRDSRSWRCGAGRGLRAPGVKTAALIALAVAALSLGGCQRAPEGPEFQNPFDPLGPGGGDPLHVTAAVSDTMILVLWDQPQGLGITSYDINHSTSYGTGYEYVATVAHTTNSSNRYLFANPAPTSNHYFRIQAFTEAGDFTIISYQEPGAAVTPPRLRLLGDGRPNATALRYVEVEVTVSSEVRLLIADNPAMLDAQEWPVPQPGQPQAIPWDLGPAAANGDTSWVYVVAYEADDGASLQGVLHAVVDFSPDFTVAGVPATVATRSVDLAVATAGVAQMRFAADVESLPAAPWVAAAETYAGYMLEDSAAPQTIYGEFAGDFGFTAVTQYEVTPDLLQDAAFFLALPADHVTGESTVTGVSDAVAVWMRFSTRPDFTDAPWLAYADTALIDLGPGEGQIVVYAQYRNDFTDSAILNDYAVLVRQPVSVAFLAPGDGDVLLGGAPLLVRGLSSAGAGKAAADSVKVDLGDGAGFVPVETLDPWSLLWDVPVFAADTPLVLRARAWAGADSATAVVGVTVTGTP